MHRKGRYQQSSDVRPGSPLLVCREPKPAADCNRLNVDMLPDTPSESDELGGLLHQHLNELDESLATLNRSCGTVQDVSAEAPGLGVRLSDEPSLPWTADVLECLPPPPSPPPLHPSRRDIANELVGLKTAVVKNATAEVVSGGTEASTSAAIAASQTLPPSAPLLESLLQGIETKKLSAGEALCSLERAYSRAAHEGKKEENVEIPGDGEVTPVADARALRCRHCGVLGLQVRALAQSLAGLAARVIQWSASLSHRKQLDLIDLALCYIRPLEHLDERLEALCLELARDFQPADPPAPSSYRPPVSSEPTEAESSAFYNLM